MILNVSQVLEYQFCPRAWGNKYIARRGIESSTALKDGSYWHKLAEAWLKDEPLLPVAEGTVQDRMREFVENGNLPRYPVIGAEVTLRMPLGRHTLVGALDGIMPTGNAFYSLQWKTCAGGQDLERQCDAVRWSYHEAAYEALMNHNGYPCAGTFLGVYKKLDKPSLAAGVQPYSSHILERTPEYVAKILGELQSYANEMELAAETESKGLSLRPHRRSCILGMSRCQYWSTCYEGTPLSDLRYSDLEDRYPEEKP